VRPPEWFAAEYREAVGDRMLQFVAPDATGD
jgi:hypothetical protein